jgi:hypothetical protein
MNIIGVDFSGARTDTNTWLAQGRLDGAALRLQSCHRVSRRDLARRLAAQPGPAVAALDFPFGVPAAFARRWQPGARTMADLWAAAAAADPPAFTGLCRAFVAEAGAEPKRRGDTLFPECFSPLHRVNPNMVPMTFHGMGMLHEIGGGWRVPPLDGPGPPGRVLLEAMPGAALRALGLPYKGYKNGTRAGEKRQEILRRLEAASGLDLPGLAGLAPELLDHHDALDAVVAAVAAALWALDPGVFRLPCPADGPEMEAAGLEGWLYAPVFLAPSIARDAAGG